MVSSYMSLLEKKYSGQLDDKAKQFIRFAVDGSKRMSNLIKDLLEYSRVTTQAKEFTDVDLNMILDDVKRDLLVLTKEKGAQINSTKLPVIKADPVQMHQLFQNIIGNAVKFQGEKSPVINIRAKEIENGWLFSVKDNGIGIDPQYFDRIFQVFQRLHEQGKYPGTGIGLAVCKKIIERHGGRIWVESETGKGTTFYFTLPEQVESLPPEERDNMEMMSA
ncbi:MAG: sensor histidine kinase [Bacillota bacterium]